MPGPVDVSTPSDTEIKVVRLFNAPPSLVFDCHVKPELVRQWMLGPPGWSMPVCEIDARPGGKYRHRWREDATGNEFGANGEFHDVVAPEKLTQTEWMEGFDGSAAVDTAFQPDGAGTRLTIVMAFDSKQARDGAVATGMADGMGMSYDKLDAVLESLKA